MFQSCLSRLGAAFLLSSLALAVNAADPASGTISVDSPELTYTGGPFVISNPSALCTGNPATPCDDFALIAELPADFATTHPDATIDFEVLWDNAQEDYDLYVYENGAELNHDGSSFGGREHVVIAAGGGHREITSEVVPYIVSGGTFTATIKLIPGAPASGGGGGDEPPPVNSNATLGGPRLDVYRQPASLGNIEADEPTADVNMTTGDVFMIYFLNTIKTEFDDTYSPALTTWTDVSDPTSATTGSSDPILVSDFEYDAEGYPDPSALTRTFVIQLQLANSIISFTDDEGQTWTTSQGGGQPHGVDNESVAGGPYSSGGLPIPAAYRHAIYYCSHSIVNAFCSRSDSGGLSFNNSVPIFTGGANQSTSLTCNNHGHVKVSNDGIVYVPQETCEDKSGVVVSEDNGVTWEYRPIPDAGPGASDTSAALARDGTLYMGYANGNDGRPWVGVSKDHGRTYLYNQPIDANIGIKNTVWVECVAGDPDRAACAFHATKTSGAATSGAPFDGVWYTYLAVTYDGGASWLLQEVTPGDPVQKGSICLNGLGCPSNPPNRNLLDFFDVFTDAQGRVIIGYADGCIGVCVRKDGPATYSKQGVIARQAGGKGLFAKFDPVAATAPKGPLISGKRDERDVEIRWIAPYDGESPITGYKVYRGVAAGALTEYAQTTKPFFADHGVGTEANYFYQVSAINAVGESVRSNEISPHVGDGVEVTQLPCELPGVTVAQDADGDTAAPGLSQGDIQYVALAEPFALTNKLVFTLKVADLSTVPAGLRWAVRFFAPTAPDGGDDWFVSMSTQDSATPTFKYGYTSVISDPAVGLVGARLFTEVGDLDAASAYGADGTIVLILDKAVIGSPAAGEYLTGIAGSVRTKVTPQNNGIVDDTGGGQFYQLAGNEACDLDNAPLAIVTASPSSGGAPLHVTLDGTQSHTADGAQIVSWSFDFNDGEKLESDQGTVTHDFVQPGLYRVHMSVRDAKGRLSSNVAEAQIMVGDAVIGGGGGVMQEDRTRFGGALDLGLLAMLSALGFVGRPLSRRRKSSP